MAHAQWAAFNDHVPGTGVQTHSNATRLKIPAIGGPISTSTVLKNIANGTNLGVTLTTTRSLSGVSYNPNGGNPASGTPLANAFNNFVYFGVGTDCNVELIGSAAGAVTYTFSGLNPARRFSFKGGAVRGNSSQTNRWTKVELQSVLSFSNAHSARVVTRAQVPSLGSNQVAVTFGYNTATGDMVDWENIDPGPDGAFSIVCTHYTGAVTNGGSSSGTNGYAITGIRLEEVVVGLPIIATQPASQTRFGGEPYEFNVSAAGSPPLTYLWFRNDAIVSGATSSNLTGIANYPADDGAQFQVIVSNDFGSEISDIARLTVTNSRPIILVQPQDKTVNLGQTVNFSVAVLGSQPLSYQWYRNGAIISGASGSNYTFMAGSFNDSGQFLVVVSNTVGTTTSSHVTLAVIMPPINILPYTNVWRYDQSGRDLGTNWTALSYDDSSWQTGPGFLGLEDNIVVAPYIKTPLSLTNSAGAYVITYYFRTHFTITTIRGR